MWKTCILCQEFIHQRKTSTFTKRKIHFVSSTKCYHQEKTLFLFSRDLNEKRSAYCIHFTRKETLFWHYEYFHCHSWYNLLVLETVIIHFSHRFSRLADFVKPRDTSLVLLCIFSSYKLFHSSKLLRFKENITMFVTKAY